MRYFFLSTVCFLLLAGTCGAQQCPPPEAEIFYTKAMKEMKPAHASWIKSSAVNGNRSANRPGDIDQQAINSSASAYGRQANLSQMDIDALVMFIMMQIAKDAEQDLRDIMESMKKNLEQKKKMREVLDELKKAKKTKPGMLLSEYDSLKSLVDSVSLNKNINPPKQNRTVTIAEIDKLVDTWQDKQDSLNELSEMMSMRLQMLMERRSKIFEMITNMMKKLSDAQDAIIRNLK